MRTAAAPLRAGLLGLAGLLGSAGILGLPACGGSSAVERAAAARVDQARTLAADAGLGEDVAELLATAAGGVAARYRATYEITDAGGQTSTVTVTQRPPDRRIDLATADGRTRTSLSVGGRSFTCEGHSSGTPACRVGEPPPELGPFAPTDVEATTAALADASADYELTVTDDELAGVTLRCLVATRRPGVTDPGAGALGRLCVTTEGVLALVERPGSRVELTSLAAEVDAAAFDLPADAVDGAAEVPPGGEGDR